MLQKLWLVAGFATGSLEPLAAGLIAVTGGLVSGVASAGLGLGVFGLVVKGVVTQVENANAAGKKLTGNLGKMQKQLNGVTGEWTKFLQKASPGVAGVIAKALALLPPIFRAMGVLLPPVEKALTHIIGQLGHGLNSSGFQKFLSSIAKTTGPDIEKLATAIGNVVRGIGSLLMTFQPFSGTVLGGLDKMTAGFAKWAAGLHGTKGFQEFMTMVRTQGPTIVTTLSNLATVAAQFIKDMSGSASNMLWLKALPQITGLAAAFMKANPALVKWGMNILLVTSTGSKLLSWAKAGKQAVTEFVTPFAHGVSNIKHFVQGFGDATQAASASTGKWGSLGGKIKSAMSAIGGAGGSSWTWLKGFGSALAEDAQWAGRFAVAMGAGAWTKLKSFGSALASAASAGAEFAAGMARSAAAATLAGVQWAAATVKAVALKVAQMAVAVATRAWAMAQAVLDAVMDANPIFLIIAAVIALVAAVVYCYIHFKTFRDVVNAVGNALKAGFLAALHAVTAAVSAVVGFVKAHWPLILGIMTGPIGMAVVLIIKYWAQIKSGISAAVKFCENVIKAGFNAAAAVVAAVMRLIEGQVRNAVAAVRQILSWFGQLGSLFRGWWDRGYNAVVSVASRMLGYVRSIPGRIRSALGNLGGLLFSAGKSIVQGLINGIKSMVGAAGSAVSGVVSEIKSFLPFSPAKKGPLAGAGNPMYSGLSIARQLAQGIRQGHSLVQAASREMAAGVNLATSLNVRQAALRTPAVQAIGGQAAAAGGGTITVNVDGQKLFSIFQSQLYRYNVRNSGTVTGVVKPV
jgi:phage-related protein